MDNPTPRTDAPHCPRCQQPLQTEIPLADLITALVRAWKKHDEAPTTEYTEPPREAIPY